LLAREIGHDLPALLGPRLSVPPFDPSRRGRVCQNEEKGLFAGRVVTRRRLPHARTSMSSRFHQQHHGVARRRRSHSLGGR
jgi:hypothetical protein